MWKQISNSENCNFFLKYIITNEIYYFYLTNFIKIWETQLNKESLISNLKKNNPLLEASGSSLVDCSIDLLFKTLSSQANKSIIKYEQDQKIDLCFHISDDSFNLKFPFQFSISNPETFCEHVTLPSMVRLKELYDSEEQLMNLLSKKDEEISEYKNEGAIWPDHLKQTNQFDMNKHKKSYKPSMEFLDDKSVLCVSNNLCESFGITAKNIVVESVIKKAKITPKKDNAENTSLIKKEVKEENIISIISANAVAEKESLSNMSKFKRNNKRRLNL